MSVSTHRTEDGHGNEEPRRSLRPRADPVVARPGGARVDRPQNPRRGASLPRPDQTAGRTRPGSAPSGTTARSTSSAAPGRARAGTSPRTPNCAVSMALPGIDLVFEGVAARVTDDETLQRLAKRYAEGGWPARSRTAPSPTTTAHRAPARRRGTSTRSRRPRSSASCRTSRAGPRGGGSREACAPRGTRDEPARVLAVGLSALVLAESEAEDRMTSPPTDDGRSHRC